jgi:hypothetical protein
MRIGQARALRHEDIVAWERRITIRAREGERRRARTKGGAQGAIPVGGELLRLWSDYMHEEYRDLDTRPLPADPARVGDMSSTRTPSSNQLSEHTTGLRAPYVKPYVHRHRRRQ